MGALLGLQLMPRNEGRSSQLWGGRGEKRERLEHVWRIRESRRETNVLSGKKTAREIMFCACSPHIKSLPRWFDRGTRHKMYSRNENARLLRSLNK